MPAQFAESFDCQVAEREGVLHVQVDKAGPDSKTINRDYGFVFDLPMNDLLTTVLPIVVNNMKSMASNKQDYCHGNLTFTTWGVVIELFCKHGNVFVVWEKGEEGVDLGAIAAGMCEMFYL